MLHVHRSERATALIGPLVEVYAKPLPDPLMAEVLVVPGRGVQRWVTQQLSQHLGARAGAHDGVCANISFPSLASLTQDVLSMVAGVSPTEDPWRPSTLRWTVLEVIDESVGEPWCSALGRHLGVRHPAVGLGPAGGAGDEAGRRDGDGVRTGRRLSVAQHLTRLFTAYGMQRPGMLVDWARGHDIGDRVLPDDLRWQPELWRRVRARVGVPSPAERLGDVLDVLTEDPGRVGLPPRLSVFGAITATQSQLGVVDALSRDREVHLWLVHPSPGLWQAVTGSCAGVDPGLRVESGRHGTAGPRISAHTSFEPRRPGGASVAEHPLLRSMARDLDELQRRLAVLNPSTDTHHVASPVPSTLLGALQQQVRADRSDGPLHVIDPGDRSVQVHSCYGRTRQVEVLREVLVGLFADDPSLQPRDVVVMCPDVEGFAPLIAASFGATDDQDDTTHPGHGLRVQVADRSLREANPVLSLLTAVLALADGRVTASQVLDLAGSEPVRRRFGFDEDDLERVREWTVDGGVHWGEGAERRARYGLPDLRQGTWATALDRILLGVAMADEDQRFVRSALPLDDVDSTDIDLAGRLAELIDRLADVLARLTGTRPLGAWLDDLDRTIDLLADVPAAQAWQIGQARQIIGAVRLTTSDDSADQVGLRLSDMRSLLADRLQGRLTRSAFRTGNLTVCSLEPLRGVPHRVVCMLGMDDGAFPRGSSLDGDDVLVRTPGVGERDRRSEDRQQFLEAVCAAEERLVVLYSGADERTGASRPPAVPLSELLDTVDRTGAGPGGSRARELVVVRHPLQAVDPRNFTAGALGTSRALSFDRSAHRGAQAAVAARVGRQPFLSGPLPVLPRADFVDLDDLISMLEHPVRWFLRQRLQVSLAGDDPQVQDRIPLSLDPLDAWQVGDRLLHACLAGADRDRSVAAEWRRGQVPPKELGRTVLTRAVEQVGPLAAVAARLSSGPAARVDVRADLADLTVVAGTVPGVHADTVVRTVYSRLGAKHRVRAWVQLLALTAAHPDRPWQVVTIGRAPGPPGALVSRFTAADPQRAGQWLEDLVRLRERALREPLPLPVSAAFEYAVRRKGGSDPREALQKAAEVWDKKFERADDYHRFCWGDVPLPDLPGGDGQMDGVERAWWPHEPTRFGVLARRVWDLPLRHEEVSRG